MTHSQFYCGNNGDALEVSNVAYSTARNPAEWFTDWATGGLGKSDAGVTVNAYTAPMHCPIWQGINIIAGDYGQTPIRLVRNEFQDQKQHPAWNLLRVKPNAHQSPSVWKETMIHWAIMYGNGVSLILRAGARPVALVPLHPECLRIDVFDYEGERIVSYTYRSPTNGYEFTVFKDDVIHIRGLTHDGIVGYPLYMIGRNTIGHGLALEKHGNKQFSNGARPGGVLQHPGKLPPDAIANLRREWDAVHAGPDNAGKIAVLWEDMKFNPITMTNLDAQWIDAKRLNVYEAASLLNLPPHKLGALQDSSVRSNLEEQNADYVNRTLNRWYTRCDEEYRVKLLTNAEYMSDEYRFLHDAGFMRGDLDTAATIADRNVKATIWSPNEGRAFIGYPPRKGGDVYGNPATGQQPEDGKASPDNGRPPRTQAEIAHRELLLDRMMHLLERESHNLNRAAANAKNFVAWLDDFYLGIGESKFAEICDSTLAPSVSACHAVGLDTRGIGPAIAAYAKKRHAQLLEACSSITKAELPATIEKLAGENQTHIAQGLLATALASSIGD